MKPLLLAGALGLVAFVASLSLAALVAPHVRLAAEPEVEAAPPAPAEAPVPGVLAPAPGDPYALRDSLGVLHERLGETDELPALRARVAELETEVAALTRRRVLADEIGQTLTRLEDRELAAIVQRLDLDVLRLIYDGAAPRVRPRLLQALPPDRAARFVDQMAGGSPRRAMPLPEPADEDPL